MAQVDSIDEATPVEKLPGVGKAKREALARLGIETVGDLLLTAPRAYEDRRFFVPIAEVAEGGEGERRCFRLTVRKIETRTTKRNLRLTRAEVTDDEGTRALAVWFNRDWRARRLRPGARFAAFAEVKRTFAGIELHVRDEDLDAAGKRLGVGRMHPIYPGTKGLYPNDLPRLLEAVRERFTDDPVPEPLRPKGLPSRGEALRRLHRPRDPDEPASGRRRLAFDEFLGLRLLVELLRADRKPRARPRTGKRELLERTIENLPFSLTPSQEEALAEILHDLAAAHPCRRLLQGEVGSGKTVVALLAAAVVLDEGESVAFVAPTEILAHQHRSTAEAVLGGQGVRVWYLTGGTPKEEREAFLAAALREDEPVFVVGTHALLERDVAFARLGLLVVDEQQRFGVGQRAELEKKGLRPDLLLLSATPIPRTLARAVYGDLDVSTIAEPPATRAGVTTVHLREKERAKMMKPLRKALEAGDRVFFVYPAIEGGDEDVKAAEEQAKKIAKAFPERGVRLLTGRMSSEEKAAAIDDFRSGKAQILVATSVVEVGIDVPEATLVVVEHADRFGLAALHQIRGRVGRGAKKGLAILTTPDEMTEKGEARIAALLETNDGFAVAERDLALRGPGEFLGERQSGLAEIRVARLDEDVDLLEAASEAARRIREADPRLEAPAHAGLRPWVLRFYRRGKAAGVV